MIKIPPICGYPVIGVQLLQILMLSSRRRITLALSGLKYASNDKCHYHEDSKFQGGFT
jgi:hypothetical protein